MRVHELGDGACVVDHQVASILAIDGDVAMLWGRNTHARPPLASSDCCYSCRLLLTSVGCAWPRLHNIRGTYLGKRLCKL